LVVPTNQKGSGRKEPDNDHYRMRLSPGLRREGIFGISINLVTLLLRCEKTTGRKYCTQHIFPSVSIHAPRAERETLVLTHEKKENQ
jgi:hypothetical protein